MKSQKMILGILGVPVNTKGEFLVTYRKDTNPQTHNKWQIAGGGMEFGEQPEETLIREMKEELNVEAKILSPYSINITQTWVTNGHGKHVYLTAYLVDIGDQEITLNEEASEYKWVTPETLDVENSLPATLTLLERAQELLEKLQSSYV